jgi:hypothetical protein
VSPSTFRAVTPMARLWRRLALPVNPVEAADTLLGISPPNARQLLAVALATSPEADELVAGIPMLLRSLAVSTTTKTVRCDGEIRGPVMWAETMAARASSPGAGGVYICASPTKAYDTEPNQVLVAAFMRLYRAAGAAEHEIEEGEHHPRPEDVVHARHNGEAVRRALEHRSLHGVSRIKPSGRMMQKTRTGTKAGVFRTAVALLQRSWAEVGADDLDDMLDPATRSQHELAADIVEILDFKDILHDRLRIVDGALVGGPFEYRHPASSSVRAHGATPGVIVRGRLINKITEVAELI